MRYTNEAAELLQGARLPGVAGVVLGLPPDPGGLGRSPAGLAEYEHPELVLHHAVLYSGLGATQDEILLAIPLQDRVGMGLTLSRVGADGIMRVDEGEDPDFDNPRTFSASDWVGTLGVGRSWMRGRLLAGGAVRFLYRDLDQTGVGAQTEASMVWKDPRGWRVGARLDRGFGSFAGWESGRREYSPAEVMVGGGIEKKMPYFYGRGFLGWESPGLIHGEANTTFTDKDTRLQEDPWLFLRASRLGGEFRFDFGGVLRAGCEVQALTRLTDFLQDKDEDGLFGESSGMVSFGAGYLWSNRARIDYALVVDPDLGNMHRVALGLVFGARSAPRKPVVRDEREREHDSARVPLRPVARQGGDSMPAAPRKADSVVAPVGQDAPEVAPPPASRPAPDSAKGAASSVAPQVAEPATPVQAGTESPVVSTPVPAPPVASEPAPQAVPAAPTPSREATPAVKPAASRPANDDDWDAPEKTE